MTKKIKKIMVAAGCTVYGYLDTTVHVLPILKDSAKAYTAVTSGGDAVSKVKNKTTVYAYNSKGVYETKSDSASGAGAMEGWGGQVTASIRSMVKAKGTHQGKNGTVSSYVKVSTSWKK